jgi:hypothetical protein
MAGEQHAHSPAIVLHDSIIQALAFRRRAFLSSGAFRLPIAPVATAAFVRRSLLLLKSSISAAFAPVTENVPEPYRSPDLSHLTLLHER